MVNGTETRHATDTDAQAKWDVKADVRVILPVFVDDMTFASKSAAAIDQLISAISVAKHPEHHGRMKQLDLSWYWLRDVVHKEIIAPVFVPTND